MSEENIKAEEYVERAKLAEQAERYDDMAMVCLPVLVCSAIEIIQIMLHLLLH